MGYSMKPLHVLSGFCLALLLVCGCTAKAMAETVCSGGNCDGLVMDDVYNVPSQETVNNATVVNNGELSLEDNSSATNIVVSDGGKISAGYKVTIDGLTLENGSVFDFAGSRGENSPVISNATQNGNEVSIQDDLAKGFVVNNGSSLDVKKGENITVEDGGNLKLYNASNIVVNGGTVDLEMADGVVVNAIDQNIIDYSTFDTSLKTDDLRLRVKDYLDLEQKYADGEITKEEFSTAMEQFADMETALNDSTNVLTNLLSYASFSATSANNLTINAIPLDNTIPLNMLRDYFQVSAKFYDSLVTDKGDSPVNAGMLDYFIGLYTLASEMKEQNIAGPNVIGNIKLTNSSLSDWGIISNLVRMENVDLNDGSFVVGLTQLNGPSGHEVLLDNVRFNEGSTFFLDTASTVINSTQEGKEVSIIDHVADGFSVNKNSMLVVSNGDKAKNITVNDGGLIMAAFDYYYTDGNAELDNIVLNEGALFDLHTDVTMTNSTQEGKEVSIKDKVADGLTINDGSVLTVKSDGTAKNTLVEDGGTLIAKKTAQINNLVAHGGAILNIDAEAILSGDIVIDKQADTSFSDYDFSALFAAMNKDTTSLTLTGGVHDSFADKLINEDVDENKSLTLAQGDYVIANTEKDGATKVTGWDVINIEADTSEDAKKTTVKLESDISLQGSNKNFVVGENAVLDLSGHSPLDVTIDGNVINKGLMDFTVNDTQGEADDTTTITGNYTAQNGATIALNVDPDTLTADKLVIDGDVVGNTNVFLKTSSENSADGDILFAQVPNDNPDTESSFDIWRVEGSPYKWSSKFEDNNWYTYVSGVAADDDEEPGDNKPVFVPEMVAYAGLYDAGFEQTRSLARAIASNSGKNGLLGSGCRDGYCRKIEPLHTAWAVPVYSNVKVKAPYDYEADISGLDAGFDLVADGINKLGILVSYRDGSYDFSGKSDDFMSYGGADIDIDSYLLGIYARHDKGHLKALAAAFAGVQSADIQSDDGVKADTDAVEAGVTLDVAYIYEAVKGVTLEPELQASYTMLKYDDIKDNAGKNVKFDTAHRVEIDAGVKIKKSWQLDEAKAAIYVKPSLVQTFNSGGDLVLANDATNTLDDQTLGRVEIGADFQLDTRWSVGASASHTFNSDYEDTSFNLDLQYRF